LLKRDERIKALEEQLEWFRGECLRQSSMRDSYQAKAEKWEQLYKNVEDEKNFIQAQYTKQKRQNKILKLALGKTQENCDHLLSITRDNMNQVTERSKSQSKAE